MGVLSTLKEHLFGRSRPEKRTIASSTTQNGGLTMTPGRVLTREQAQKIAQQVANDPATTEALRKSRAEFGQPMDYPDSRGV